MDMGKAKSAIKNAWIAGAISGVLTMIFSLIGAFGYDLWSLIDAFLILGLSFGIYKKNRACAVILFVYWIGSKILQIVELGVQGQVGSSIGTLPIAIIFGYYFFQGIRGTFAYRRIVKEETKEEKIESGSINKKSKRKPFLIGCGVAVAVVVAIVIVFIIWAASGPLSGVLMSNEMEEYALEYIEQHNLLNDTESLIAYYDVTISMDSSEAAILTTESIMYHKDGRTVSIALKDIDDVRHRYETLIGDIIEVRSKSGMRLKIEIAPLNNGESFYNALMDAWNLQKTR